MHMNYCHSLRRDSARPTYDMYNMYDADELTDVRIQGGFGGRMRTVLVLVDGGWRDELVMGAMFEHLTMSKRADIG